MDPLPEPSTSLAASLASVQIHPSTPPIEDRPTSMTPTIFMPIASPPTPSPSPRPSYTPSSLLHAQFASSSSSLLSLSPSPSSYSPGSPSYSALTLEAATSHALSAFSTLHTPSTREPFLLSVLSACTPSELAFIARSLAPRLKRDFLGALPAELALHVLSFVRDARTLVRCAAVSHSWRNLTRDERVWAGMVRKYGYDAEVEEEVQLAREKLHLNKWSEIPYRRLFEYFHTTHSNWHSGGRLLRAHALPPTRPDESGVVTSLAADAEWVIVGLNNARVQTFSAKTGVLARTLVGHAAGVWAVCLVSAGGRWAGGPEGEHEFDEDEDGEAEEGREDGPAVRRNVDRAFVRKAVGELVPPNEPVPEKLSDPAFTSDGWGQPGALVVSGGCDKDLRVWDVLTGRCVHVMPGHTSTVRCIRVLHARPIAVSGARDGTVRVWDVRAGRCLRLLLGHTESVRAIDVHGNRAVSGSYDRTCRLWDLDTGECIHVLRGHYHQIYTVAFDGIRVASAGLDTTVRVWSAETGECQVLLQGHTALVCQLQLCTAQNLLATAGSDGRVLTFSLTDFSILHRIPAHDSSVASLQLHHRILISGGNDGKVRVFDPRSGKAVRELGVPCETVWKVVVCARGGGAAVACKRAGKTVVEVWGFRPGGSGPLEGWGEERA